MEVVKKSKNKLNEKAMEKEKYIKNEKPYEVIFSPEANKGPKPLEKIAGHQKQKEELIQVVNWFKQYKYWQNKGVSIPKGIVLYGPPGNGKTLIIKEIINYSGVPAFIFKGEMTNVKWGIEKTFEDAKKKGQAIIVFDELNLLLANEERVTKILQDNLDGIKASDGILVIAATNHIHELPFPLLRNGRFDTIIHVPNPTTDEAF